MMNQPQSTPAPNTRLRWLPYVFAAGAVFWLVELAQFAAIVAAPAGREQLYQPYLKAGFVRDATTMVVVEVAFIAMFEVTAAALHATAFYGLRRWRAWGWIAAVVVASAWSLVLIGLPMLVFLLQRPTRQAYGVP
jgi:hypothetical protein